MVVRPMSAADQVNRAGGVPPAVQERNRAAVSVTSPALAEDPRYGWRPPTVLLATLLTLFAVVAVKVGWNPRPTLGDTWTGTTLLRQPHDLGWRLADAVSFCASGPGVVVLAVICAAWLAIARRELIGAIAVLAAPAVAGVVEIAMKSIIGRPRPLTAALSGESGDGFPSGHVAGYAALTVTLLVVFVLSPGLPPLLRRLWTAAVVSGIVLVMWSRVALGAHYASDTVGGALLGTAIGLCALPAVILLVGPLRARLQTLR